MRVVRAFLSIVGLAALLMLLGCFPPLPYEPPALPGHIIQHCWSDTLYVPRYWINEFGEGVYVDSVMVTPCPRTPQPFRQRG